MPTRSRIKSTLSIGISRLALGSDWLPEAGGFSARWLADALRSALRLRVINLCSCDTHFQRIVIFLRHGILHCKQLCHLSHKNSCLVIYRKELPDFSVANLRHQKKKYNCINNCWENTIPR